MSSEYLPIESWISKQSSSYRTLECYISHLVTRALSTDFKRNLSEVDWGNMHLPYTYTYSLHLMILAQIKDSFKLVAINSPQVNFQKRKKLKNNNT